MTSANLYINIDHLREIKSTNNHSNMNDITICGNEHIAKGGTVIVQQEYINSAPIEIVNLNNEDSFNEWINNFFEVK